MLIYWLGGEILSRIKKGYKVYKGIIKGIWFNYISIGFSKDYNDE
jgi:hypothetical protein